MSRLIGGHTVDDVRKALAAAPDDENALKGIVEDDSPISDLGRGMFPGSGLSITGSGIDDGDYALICHVHTADGKPHFSLGMVSGFSVGAGKATATPKADQTYTVTDGDLKGPETLHAGRTVLKMVNDSTSHREIEIGRLKDGKTFEDAGKFFAQFTDGPPTAEKLKSADNPIAFFTFIFDAEQDRYVTVDLRAGTYLITMHNPEQPFEGDNPTDDPNAIVVKVG